MNLQESTTHDLGPYGCYLILSPQIQTRGGCRQVCGCALRGGFRPRGGGGGVGRDFAHEGSRVSGLRVATRVPGKEAKRLQVRGLGVREV